MSEAETEAKRARPHRQGRQQQDAEDDRRRDRALVKHPKYGKYIRRTTKLLAHDEKNEVARRRTVYDHAVPAAVAPQVLEAGAVESRREGERRAK